MSSYVSAVDPLIYQTGFLTINENGAILASGGELENDERKAEILYRLVSIQQKPDKFLEDGCTRLSVNFQDHSYVICLSNKKIHVVKKKMNLTEEEDAFNVDTNVSIDNSINA